MATTAEMLKKVNEYCDNFEVMGKNATQPEITDYSRFTSIEGKMAETFKKKNHDYGNSFSDTYKEFGDAGLITAATQISHKYHRFVNAVKGTPLRVNESIEDTLLDMANYCIMTIIEIQKGKENKVAN
jgi:hypothetical protein